MPCPFPGVLCFHVAAGKVYGDGPQAQFIFIYVKLQRGAAQLRIAGVELFDGDLEIEIVVPLKRIKEFGGHVYNALAGPLVWLFIDLGGVDILYHASNFLFDALGQPQFKLLDSIKKKMEAGEIGPKTGKGFFDYSKVNVESMFEDRYKGFLELLNLVRHSKVLRFEGGIRPDA